jgi:hypothetical protein
LICGLEVVKHLWWLSISKGPIPCMPLENILIPCMPLTPHVIDTKKYTYMPLSGTQGMSIKFDGIPGIFSSLNYKLEPKSVFGDLATFCKSQNTKVVGFPKLHNFVIWRFPCCVEKFGDIHKGSILEFLKIVATRQLWSFITSDL